MSFQHMVKILYDYMSSVSEGVNTSLFLSEGIGSNPIRNTNGSIVVRVAPDAMSG